MNQKLASQLVRLSPSGIVRAKKAKGELTQKRQKQMTQPVIADEVPTSLSTVKRFFNGQGILLSNAYAIGLALEIPKDELDTLLVRETASESGESIEFVDSEQKLVLAAHRLCQSQLERMRNLTSNPLLTSVGSGFDFNDIYVPIGLVKREKLPKHHSEIQADKGSSFYGSADFQEEQFSPEAFLRQVLEAARAGTQIRATILGEAGSGKTTFLQWFAFNIFDRQQADIVIWVPARELGQKTLEDYLTNVWLKNALETTQISPEMKEALATLFSRRRVWLVIDGLDEMILKENDNPLTWLSTNLSIGWIRQAQVFLSCRLSHWNNDWNPLSSDVYQILDLSTAFTTTDAIDTFINKWWRDNPERGLQLQTQLRNPKNSRLRDLVKNPLRLTLLCRIWEFQEGELPQTKAELFAEFVKAFYYWKQDHRYVSQQQKEELHQALGQLSLQALEENNSRFCLRRSLLESFFATKPDLLELITELGWLSPIGFAADKPREEVYAFWHPTFQEYFAAIAINSKTIGEPSWNFFVPSIHVDRPVTTEGEAYPYRVFNPKWREVLLLWFGRNDIEDTEKEKLIEKLSNFDDACGGFYSLQAWCLAAAVLHEFEPRSIAASERIVEQLIEWILRPIAAEASQETCKSVSLKELIEPYPFIYNWEDIEESQSHYYSIAKRAKIALSTTNPDIAATVLLRTLSKESSQTLRRMIIRLLGEIGNSNIDVAIKLTDLAQNDSDNTIRQEALHQLCEAKCGTLKTVEFLIGILRSRNLIDLYVCRSVNRILRSQSINEEIVLDILKQKLQEAQDIYTEQSIAESLLKLYPDKTEAISLFIQYGSPDTIGYAGLYKEYGLDREKAINSLSVWLKKYRVSKKDEHEIKRCWAIATQLRELEPGNSDAVKKLEQLLPNTSSRLIQLRVARSLCRINPKHFEATAVLVKLFKYSQNDTERVEILIDLPISQLDEKMLVMIKGWRWNLVSLCEKDQVEVVWNLINRISTDSLMIQEMLIDLMCHSLYPRIQLDISKHFLAKKQRVSQAIDIVLKLFDLLSEEEQVDLIEFFVKNEIKDLKSISIFNRMLSNIEKEELYIIGIQFFTILEKNKAKAIEFFTHLIDNSNNLLLKYLAIKNLQPIYQNYSVIISLLVEWLNIDLLSDISPNIDRVKEPTSSITSEDELDIKETPGISFPLPELVGAQGLKRLIPKEYFGQVVSSIRNNLQSDSSKLPFNYASCYAIALYCAEHLPYSEFYDCFVNSSNYPQ